MKITTKQFGEIQFGEDQVIKFKSGLYGFEELKDYLLIKTEDDLFYWLNSIDEPEIAFPLIGVRIIDDEYPVEENREPFAIAILDTDPLNITINMKAPVYIDQDRKVGSQKILDDDKYHVKYNLFVE